MNGIIPLVPGLPERLRAGIDALDIGCGQGHAVNVLAKAFPESRFRGLDMSGDGIAAARAEAAELTLTKAEFQGGDCAGLTGLFGVPKGRPQRLSEAQPPVLVR